MFSTPYAQAKRLHAESRALKAGAILSELSDDRLVELGRVAGTAAKLREMRSNYEMAMAGFLDRETWGAKVDVNAHVTTQVLVAFADMAPPIQAQAHVDDEAHAHTHTLPHVAAPDGADVSKSSSE